MEGQEIKRNFEEVLNNIHNFKSDFNSIKEESATEKAKFEKQLNDIAKGMEEHNNKIKMIEALSENRAKDEEKNELNKKKEANKHFNAFIRTSGKMDINEFCERKGIELNAMSVDSDPDGGYLVLPTYDSIRKTREFETSPIRQVANVMNISSDRLIVPVDYDEVTASWVGERSTRLATDTAQLGQIEIPVHEIYALQNLTQQIIDDAKIDVESQAAKEAGEKFARKENTAFVSGNGVAQPLGFLSYSAWTTNGTFEHGKIEQINSGSSGAFTANGLLDLQNGLLEIYQPKAVFIVKRASFGAIMKLVDGEDNYLFNRALNNNVGRPFDLLGAPVMFASDMPTAAANSLSLVYGDFNAGYQIVDRSGVRILRDPYSNKPYVQLYQYKRVGGGVVNFEAIKIQKLAA